MAKKKTNNKTVEIIATVVIAIVVVVSMVAAIVANYSRQPSGQQIQLTQVMNLLTSADNYYSQAMQRGNENDYAGARIKLEVAESNVIEAKNLLNVADLDSSTKQYCLYLCDYMLNAYSMMGSLSYGLEYYKAGSSAFNDNDYTNAASKFSDAKNNISQAQSYFLYASENLNSIDKTALPLDIKNFITEKQALFDEYKTFLPDFASITDAFIPFVRGCGHLLEAVSYMQLNNWHAAKIAFENSVPDVTDAKTRFDNLRYCQTLDFSSSASKMFSIAVKFESALSHYIQGCEYAEAGKMELALAEFDMANNILA